MDFNDKYIESHAKDFQEEFKIYEEFLLDGLTEEKKEQEEAFGMEEIESE